MKRDLLLTVLCLLVTAAVAHAQGSTGTSAVSLTVTAEASITVNTGTTMLTSSGIFADYTGSTSLTYLIRTTQTTGSGNIVLKVTTDFNCAAGGPCVATPPTAGDKLAYTCTADAPGTACSGSQTASTSATTPVASFGADAHTNTAGASATVGWSLTNDPIYKTGPYSATVTFTISAS